MSDVIITGDKELLRVFRELPDRIGRRVLRKAVSKAATPIVRAAKSKAPTSKQSGRNDDSGQKLFKKSLGKVVRTYKSSRSVVAIIGSRRAEQFKGRANIAHLLEKGHKIVRGGETKGFVEARRFLGPAFDEQKGRSMRILETEIGAGIETEAAKLAGKVT